MHSDLEWIKSHVWDKTRCHATIYKRDTYRCGAPTKSGFEMHYAKQQCSRNLGHGAEGLFCRQHAKQYPEI